MFELFLQALIVHLVADCFLQSDWMTENKADLNNFAGWVHAGIHTAGNLLVFPTNVALVLGFAHLLIDTRRPLVSLRAIFNQNPKGPVVPVFEVWQDQAAHFILLILAVLYASGFIVL
jgi:hypothetical protein